MDASTKKGVPMTFIEWYQRWTEIARYEGDTVPEFNDRIEKVVALWREPVPAGGVRPSEDLPLRLLGTRRYTRSDIDAPHAGEHDIEHQILSEKMPAPSLENGAIFLDGVNGFPLAIDSAGGRECNVEADILLLVQYPDRVKKIVAGEVKTGANNPWYAAIENLRQLKLLYAAGHPGLVFEQRKSLAPLESVGLSGMVIAPNDYYQHRGQKANSIAPTKSLLERFCRELGIHVELIVWDDLARSLRTT